MDSGGGEEVGVTVDGWWGVKVKVKGIDEGESGDMGVE